MKKQSSNPICSVLDNTFKIKYPAVLFLLHNLNLNSQISEFLQKFMFFSLIFIVSML